MITCFKWLVLLVCWLSYPSYASTAAIQIVNRQYGASYQPSIEKNQRYDDTPNLCYRCINSSVENLQEKALGGSFFAFEIGLVATKGRAKIFNIRGVGNLDLSSAGVDRLLALNGSRLGQKLGTKIGEGRLPFTPGREGFNQALDAVKNILKNATDVVGPMTGARGRNTVIDVFSNKTGFTVRLRADGAFDTLIEGATPLVRP